MLETLTLEERRKYNSMHQEARRLAEQMGKARGWSDRQILTQATILNITLTQPLPDEKENNPNVLWKDILVKAKNFISSEFPRIYIQVKDAFQRAIEYIQKAIDTAIDIAIDILVDIFG